MRLRIVIFLMALSLPCSFANSDEVSHRAAAEELLLLTEVDKRLESMYEQVEPAMEVQFTYLGAPEKLRPVLVRYTEQLVEAMKEDFAWAKLKNEYIDIYVKTYTEEELRAISEFYKSPAGKKSIEKMPQVMQESMAISQSRMPAFMKKMKKAAEEMANEIKQLKEQAEIQDEEK